MLLYPHTQMDRTLPAPPQPLRSDEHVDSATKTAAIIVAITGALHSTFRHGFIGLSSSSSNNNNNSSGEQHRNFPVNNNNNNRQIAKCGRNDYAPASLLSAQNAHPTPTSPVSGQRPAKQTHHARMCVCEEQTAKQSELSRERGDHDLESIPC